LKKRLKINEDSTNSEQQVDKDKKNEVVLRSSKYNAMKMHAGVEV
jgi:hypothetical protein